MQTLRDGAQGPDVAALQQKLVEKGFSPGYADGNFGPGTEAAVLAFQRSEGLVVDGVVGPSTAAALGFTPETLPPPAAMPAITVAVAAKMVPDAPLDNIAANLPLVLNALVAAGLTSTPIVLAAIATIRVETGRFAPIDEYVSRYNTPPGGPDFSLYDFRRDLGNGAAGDGARYKGRGFVQLTGKANYQLFGPEVGADLIGDPDLANEPETAAKILAAFLKAQQTRIATALVAGDYADARRAVNGGTFGLDDLEASYETGIALVG